MIIRRRHTSSFTVVPNAVANDESLSLDEKGALVWLLTRPHDWEVRKTACSKVWGVGRDTLNRIFRSLIEAGWVRRIVLRAEDGTVLGVRFEVHDQPAEEGERTATSGLGGRAEEDADDADDAPEGAGATPPPPENPHPWTASPSTEKPSEELNNDKGQKRLPPPPQREIRTAPPAAPPQAVRGEVGAVVVPTLDQVIAAWPQPPNSRMACERVWARLGDAARRAAWAAVKAYLADARVRDRKVCDLATYLREARWERFGADPRPGPVAISPGTPQWWRWREYRMATAPASAMRDSKGRPFTVQMMDQASAGNRSIMVQSEWPPPVAAGVPVSTGPPAPAP